MIDPATLSTLMNDRNISAAAGSAVAARTALVRSQAPMSETQAGIAAQNFESMFLTAMMEPMFGDSIGEGLFGDDETQEVYKHLLMEQYGKKITEAGGIGIADFVKQELLRQQEVNR